MIISFVLLSNLSLMVRCNSLCGHARLTLQLSGRERGQKLMEACRIIRDNLEDISKLEVSNISLNVNNNFSPVTYVCEMSLISSMTLKILSLSLVLYLCKALSYQHCLKCPCIPKYAIIFILLKCYSVVHNYTF